MRPSPVLPLAQQVAQKVITELVPGSAPGIGAALQVDALINKINNPIVTAALAPVFLGTGAIKGIASAVGDVLFGASMPTYSAAEQKANAIAIGAGDRGGGTTFGTIVRKTLEV